MVQTEVKMVQEMRAAFIFHNGAVAAIGDDMGRLIDELMGWVMKRGVKMAGPPFAVYYSSPDEMSRGEMQFEVGIAFVGEAQEEGNIQIKTFPAQNVLSAIHKGPYLSLIHISEPTRRTPISYAVFCLKKKKRICAGN